MCIILIISYNSIFIKMHILDNFNYIDTYILYNFKVLCCVEIEKIVEDFIYGFVNGLHF